METQTEDDAQTKPSVAELAGRFKGHALPIPTGSEGVQHVRRRPPRTLQLSNRTQEPGEEDEKPAPTSPHPAKTKRNSALIEKLQANLALSPCALPTSPKSPGLRFLPPSFTPLSPCSPKTPTSPVSATAPPQRPSEDEPPATFETPASSSDSSILPSINKSRARVSIKRRPPSRRHRKSSNGEEVGGAKGEDTPLNTPDGPEPKAGGEEKGDEVLGGGEKEEVEEGAGEVKSAASEADGTQTESEPAPSDSPTQAAAAETEPLDTVQSETTEECRAEEREGGRERGEEVKEAGEDRSSSASKVHEDTDGTTQTSSVSRDSGEGDEVPCEKKGEMTTDPQKEEENKVI